MNRTPRRQDPARRSRLAASRTSTFSRSQQTYVVASSAIDLAVSLGQLRSTAGRLTARRFGLAPSAAALLALVTLPIGVLLARSLFFAVPPAYVEIVDVTPRIADLALARTRTVGATRAAKWIRRDAGLVER